MEWMLQVVDEIDDAVAALRLYYLGIAAEIGLILAASLGVGATCAATLLGAEVSSSAELSLIFSAVIVLGLAAALKIHELRLPGNR